MCYKHKAHQVGVDTSVWSKQRTHTDEPIDTIVFIILYTHINVMAQMKCGNNNGVENDKIIVFNIIK